MKNKIMLFDASGVQIGETFMRRARQLVNQQRAEWINDAAIRFIADIDLTDADWSVPEPEEASVLTKGIRDTRGIIDTGGIRDSGDIRDTGPEALLYYLAEERIKDRNNFILHSLLIMPGIFVIVVLASMMHGRQADTFLAAMVWGWFTPYFLHAFVFIRNRIRDYRPDHKSNAFERELDKVRRIYG